MARRNTIWGEILLAAASYSGAWLFCMLLLGIRIDDANTVGWLLAYMIGCAPVGIGLTVAVGGSILKSAVQLHDSFFYNYSSALWVALLTVLVVFVLAMPNAEPLHDDWYPLLAYLHMGFLAVWGYCMLSRWRGVY